MVRLEHRFNAGTSPISIVAPVYFAGAWDPVPNTPNAGYVPVNFLFTTNTPPTVSITAPSNGATLSGSTTLTASATAGSGQTIASVQFQLDGSNVGSPVTAAPYSVSLNTASFSNGAHAVRAVATDSAQSSTTSQAISVTISNSSGQTPPVVSITSPLAGATVSGNGTVSASASAASGRSISSVQFQVSGNNYGSPVTSAPYSITLNTTDYPNGSISLAAVATDSSGISTTSQAVAVNVNNAAGTTTSPFISNTGYTVMNPRNNFSSWLGLQFTVGASPITITALGRLMLAGNSGTHAVKLVNPATGADVAGLSTTVNLAGGTVGQFVYGQLVAGR